MIFPFSIRFREIGQYPLTLVLIALNIVAFLMFFPESPNSKTLDQIFSMGNLEIAGKLYLSTTHHFERPEWAQNAKLSDSSSMALLGALALRDDTFMRKIAEMPENSFHPAEFNQFKAAALQIKKMDEESPATLYGLSPKASSPFVWITYQFSHGDFIHLLSNLLFLWLVGSLIEVSFGAGALMVLYIVGGICGGFLFLLMQDHGSAPVIGASGAISCLVAFYAMAHGMKRVSFAYFVAPFPEYFGVIYLPALILVPVFLVSDFASLFATPPGLALGVAHAAHVGGALFGFAMGFAYYMFSSTGANPLRKVFSAIATGSKNCFK